MASKSSRRRSRSRDKYRKRSTSRDRHGHKLSQNRHKSRSISRDKRASSNTIKTKSRSPTRDRPSRENRPRSKSPPRKFERRGRTPTRDRFTWRRFSPGPHLSALERDSRTVFVMQLSQKVQPRDIAYFFEDGAGKVNEVRIVNDRSSGRSKGVAYVELVDRNAVSKAMMLTGHRMNGVPLVVMETQSEKNNTNFDHMVQEGPEVDTKLYVSSIHYTVTEEELRSIFEQFGSVEYVDLHRDSGTGKSRGFAYVQFYNTHDAKEAVDRLNGFEIAGKQMKVGISTDQTVPLYSAVHENDENEDGIAPLSAASRQQLMSKLMASRSTTSANPSGEAARPHKNIMIKNAFDPSQESGEDWITDIEEDFRSEITKFGKVIHCKVDPKSLGFIYAKFSEIESAKKAIEVLNGRFFAGRQLQGSFLAENIYNSKFPNAK